MQFLVSKLHYTIIKSKGIAVYIIIKINSMNKKKKLLDCKK